VKEGKVPFDVVEQALYEGLIGREYIDELYEWYRSSGGRRLA